MLGWIRFWSWDETYANLGWTGMKGEGVGEGFGVNQRVNFGDCQNRATGSKESTQQPGNSNTENGFLGSRDGSGADPSGPARKLCPFTPKAGVNGDPKALAR